MHTFGQRTVTPIRRGFTLIELLVVIVIIGILAGGVFMMMNSANSKAAIAKTTAQVHALASLLEEYKAIYGEYPIVTAQYTYNDKPIGYAALEYRFVTEEGDDAHPSYGNSGNSSSSSGLKFKIKDGTSTRTVTPKFARGSGDEMTFGLCSHFMPRATTILNNISDDLKTYYRRQFQSPKKDSPYELEMKGLNASDALSTTAAKEAVDPHLQQIYRSWRRLLSDGMVEAGTYTNIDTGSSRFIAGATEDAWERTLVYKNDGGAGEIVSAGPDGIFGTADDISSGGTSVDESDED